MRSVLRSSISFNVKRGKPVVVAPAKATPHEEKLLSAIDDQINLRLYTPCAYVYHADPDKGAIDPATVIKEGLAKALVFYYPIAGRLREQKPGGSLVVDCNGKGVMFAEAEADVQLADLGDLAVTFYDQFLFDSELMGPGVVDQPLLYAQITRFKCGGFSFGIRLCHIIIDGLGAAQFLNAVGELSRGANQPSVFPVWDRHRLFARDPPMPSQIHREYEPIEGATQEQYDLMLKAPLTNLEHRTFFFGPSEILALRKQVQSLQQFSHVSTFELIAAAAWRSRTISLDYNPDFEVRLLIPVNFREKMSPPLPTGFYGNAIARAVAFDKAEKICSSPLEYALKLVKEAITRAMSSDDLLQSQADLLALRGRPQFLVVQTFLMSKLARSGFKDVDFGWGEGIFCTKPNPWFVSFYSTSKNSNGEEIVVIPMCLPKPAMARFEQEMQNLIEGHT